MKREGHRALPTARDTLDADVTDVAAAKIASTAVTAGASPLQRQSALAAPVQVDRSWRPR